MKKITLFLLFPLLMQAQLYTVDFEMNSNDVFPVWENWTSCGNSSTDATLTQILQNHGADYCSAFRLSYPSMTEVNGGIATCSCDPEELVADLLAYTGLVTKARISPEPGVYAGRLNIVPQTYPEVTGSDPANIIITDNDALNLIYQEHKVFWQNNVGTFWIELQCDCSANELRDDLFAGGFLTEGDDTFYESVAILATPQSELPKVSVYPNPFRNVVNIETDAEITGYSVYDVTGKRLVETFDKSHFDQSASQLASGLYLLKLRFENGLAADYKIVKE